MPSRHPCGSRASRSSRTAPTTTQGSSMTQTPNAPLADDTDSGRPTGLSRRAVVAGVGGVAAAGLLTACGGGSTATAPGTPAAAAPAAAPSEPAAEPPAAGG